MPRIILRNKEGDIRLELSFKKAIINVQGDVESKLDKSNEIVEHFINIVFDEFGWKINRLARVSTLRVHLDDYSIDFIKANI